MAKKPAKEAPAPEGEEGAEGEAPAKKKPPILIIAIAAGVLVLGGGGAAAFFLLKPKPAAEAGEHGAEKAEKKKEKKKDEKKAEKKDPKYRLVKVFAASHATIALPGKSMQNITAGFTVMDSREGGRALFYTDAASKKGGSAAGAAAAGAVPCCT